MFPSQEVFFVAYIHALHKTQVFLEFKITGRTKALENPKWEKIIARDKRAGGIGEDTQARVVLGLYGKVFTSHNKCRVKVEQKVDSNSPAFSVLGPAFCIDCNN